MEEPIFDFLALPAELRVKVYVYYMHGGRKITDPHALNICFLNRQIRAEFEDEAFKIRKQITDEIWRRFKKSCLSISQCPRLFVAFTSHRSESSYTKTPKPTPQKAST
jgi:hypothetical protein